MAKDTLRLALWDAGLTRDGPGLLLRDIQRGKDKQIDAVVQGIQRIRPDILVLTGYDTDAEGRTLAAFAALFGAQFPNRFTQLGNEGLATNLDMDGDGLRGTGRDAQGFGRFRGNGGLAVLARDGFPVSLSQDFTDLLWRDMPNPLLLPGVLPEGVDAVQRLSTTSHWVLRAGPLSLLIHAGTPPIFDGPEDRNGRRNHDETALWLHLLDGALGQPITGVPVVMGKLNSDPADGEARRDALMALLHHPRLQDPQPRSSEAVAVANAHHIGDPALDTADFDDPDPGNLRVDYILPAAELDVLDAGVVWPSASDAATHASRHGLIWMDVRLPSP